MKNKICNISLFSVLLMGIAGVPDDVFGATGWVDARAQQSYAGAYNQVASIREQQAYLDAQDVPDVQTASATETLPVEVEDKKLEEKIINKSAGAPDMAELERCSMINLRGKFKWGTPQSGLNRSVKQQCVAVVDLVTVDHETGSTTILATTTVGAGDSIRCNIDEFPEDSYSPEIGKFQFPADAAPTMKDVEKALNKEQKQNSGIKIAAAAIIGGLAGNMLGPKKNGDEKLLGTGKKQLETTAIGAAAAAGLMAASSYSGKVAGDTIKSTAVSATAGMMAGNMTAGLTGSDNVLATMTCDVPGADGKTTTEKDCIVGRYTKKTEQLKNPELYWTNDTGKQIYRCDSGGANCTPYNTPLAAIQLADGVPGKDLTLYTQDDLTKLNNKGLCYNDNDNAKKMEDCSLHENKVFFYRISSAWIAEASQPGYAVFETKSLPHKAFGYKMSEWDKINSELQPNFYFRNTNNSTVGSKAHGDKETDRQRIVFTPSARNAQDGSIIDLSNEARAKATIIGTAAGGALGGFAGYQGAQSEMYDRYLQATTEYSNSLMNFNCVTGTHFLSLYNDDAIIPNLPNTGN